MKKTFMALIIICPLLMLLTLGNGDKKIKQDELTKKLEFYLEENVTTGVKAILQRDSLEKMTNLSSHTALMSRIKETQNELVKQNKQLDGLRSIVLSGQ